MRTYCKSSKLLLIVVAMLTVFMTVVTIAPVTAYAKVTYASSSKSDSKKKNKAERYFSDVKAKTQYREDIEWLAKKGAFKSIAKQGKKFKPRNIITRKQMAIILDNLYGDRIDITIKDPKKKVDQGYMTKLLTEVSKQLGYQVSWNGGTPKARVTRAAACYYIRLMMKTAERGALDPK